MHKILTKNMNKRSVITSLLGIFIFCIFSCSKNEINKENTTEKNTSLPEGVIQKPDFTFRDQRGKVQSISSLKGNVVFVNFWATWCPPCIKELPSINELKKKFSGKENIVFLMIDVDQSIKNSTAFMKNNNYNLPVYESVSEIPADFLGNAIPTTVILDKSGDRILKIEGGHDYSSPEIIKTIEELVSSN